MAAAPGARLRDPARAADPVPRRADRRRRPGLARQFWRLIDQLSRLRRHRPGHHALPGRGRALPPDRDHPRRPARGARHDRRAEARSSRTARSSRSRRPSPVDAMRALDAMDDVEKTQPVRDRRARRAARARRVAGRIVATLRGAALRRDSWSRLSRRSRTCSSTWWRRRGAHEEGAGGRQEGAAADPARPAHAHDPAVRPGVLPAALRLRAELRHPARARSRSKTATAASRAGRWSPRS